VAEVVELGAAGTAEALDSLAQKYPQYAAHRPAGPFVRVNVTRWSGWSHGHSS
jgi:hypothetical protein